MRALSATLLAAQKAMHRKPLVRLVLSQGANTYTYYWDATNTSRILPSEHIEEDDNQSATVVLNDADGVLEALDLKGYKAVLSFGLTTSAGDEYSSCLDLWVIGQHQFSTGGRLLCILALAGTANMLMEDKANEAYRPADTDTNTVKTLIEKVMGDTGETILTAYDHTTLYDVDFDSEDALIDTFAPADQFRIELNNRRMTKIKELLSMVKCVGRFENDGDFHVFVPKLEDDKTTWAATTAYTVGDIVEPTTPNEVLYRCTTAGTSAGSEPTWPTEVAQTVVDGTVTWTVAFDADYRLESGYHTFFNETYRKRLCVPNYVVVSSDPSHTNQYTGFATASQTPEIRDHKYLRVTSNAQCTSIATAILTHYQRMAEKGSGIFPLDVGLEVHDLIKVKDTRLGDYRIGNVGYIKRTWGPKGFNMELHFGKVSFGLAGTLPFGAGGGAGGEIDLSAIYNLIQQLYDIIAALLARIEALEKLMTGVTIFIYDTAGNHVGTITGVTGDLSISAVKTNEDLALRVLGGGGVVISADSSGTPNAGEILLNPTVAVRVNTALIIPSL